MAGGRTPRTTPRGARRRRAWPVLAGLLAGLLAGCSGGQGDAGRDAETQFAGLEELLAGRLPGRGTPAAEGPTLIVVDPDAPPEPVLLAELPARDARALLEISGRNGPVTTWRTIDEVSLSLRAPGVLIASRGLGEDLHAADAEATAAALGRGSGAAVRRSHRSLGGDQRLVGATFDCTLVATGRETLQLGEVRRPTLRFEERCSGPAGSFTNRYWRDPSRPLLWQSVQWISPEVGSIRLQHLVE